MLIDWFTVGAQVLNFLILVWLMKRFLYQPILNAIDAREKQIAGKLADAAKKETEAQKERDDFQHKNEEFDQQRAALINQATEAANIERQRLLDEARTAADALSVQRHQTLLSDARSFSSALSRQTQNEVFAIARQTLSDLADANLETRMADVFIEQLRKMPDDDKAAFTKALKKSAEPGLLRSAFALSLARQQTIQKAINETFSIECNPHFEIAPDLISGIEFSASGLKVTWGIADYLATLEQSVGALLNEKNQSEHKPKVKLEAKLETKPKCEIEQTKLEAKQ